MVCVAAVDVLFEPVSKLEELEEEVELSVAVSELTEELEVRVDELVFALIILL